MDQALDGASQILDSEVGVDRGSQLWVAVAEQVLRLGEPDSCASELGSERVPHGVNHHADPLKIDGVDSGALQDLSEPPGGEPLEVLDSVPAAAVSCSSVGLVRVDVQVTRSVGGARLTEAAQSRENPMVMNYEELDDRTRGHMLAEYEKEQNDSSPYRSKALSPQGLALFPDQLRNAISSGNEVSLARAIEAPHFWEPEEDYTREGITRTRRRNMPQSASRLALTEFSTWYVRGYAKRLIEEGIDRCEVCRGEQPKWEPGDCAEHEGRIVSVQSIYDAHRTRYWPSPGNVTAFSIPFAPGCHHVIRRVR